MIGIYKKLFGVLDRYERRRAILLLCLFFGLGLAETLGVASIMPFMAVVGDPDIIESNGILNFLYEGLGFDSYNQFLVFLGSCVLVALIGSLAYAAFTHWFISRFTQMCNYRLSTRLLASYFSRPYVSFLNYHSADLGRTVLAEVAQMVMRVLTPSMDVVARVVVALFLLGLVVLADPLIALAAGGMLGGLYALILFGVRGYLARLGAESFDANEERYRISQEALSGIKDVKVSGLEAAYIDRYSVPALKFAERQATQEIINRLPRYLLEAVALGGMVVIVIVLLLVREEGLGAALPVIAVYAFAGYRLMPALQMIYNNLAQIKFGEPILERIYDDLVESKQQSAMLAPASREPVPPLPLERELELRDASFTYPGAESKALDRLSITIPARSLVGFVGTTGAGKTTVIDVILGLLEPDSGELIVDGEPIHAGNRRNWQRAVGYVPQHIFLVDDTVAANVAFGIPPDEIDMEAVERAARVAELHDFVVDNMPKGYQTEVGERGVRLSGGQRQRIGIARALYHDPSVLVLDEATSALDNVTEKAVMESVNKLGRAKTVLVIAHRLSTVRNCDTIFVLEGGRLSASGTYDELAQSSPAFRDMAEMS